MQWRIAAFDLNLIYDNSWALDKIQSILFSVQTISVKHVHAYIFLCRAPAGDVVVCNLSLPALTDHIHTHIQTAIMLQYLACEKTLCFCQVKLTARILACIFANYRAVVTGRVGRVSTWPLFKATTTFLPIFQIVLKWCFLVFRARRCHKSPS